MKDRLYNFFNHPWVAFPLVVIFFLLFFGLTLHYADRMESHKIDVSKIAWLN